MRNPTDRLQMLRNLRYALEVMEERYHLGLDEKAAGAVRSALLHQIVAAEEATPGVPPSPQTEELRAEEQLIN